MSALTGTEGLNFKLNQSSPFGLQRKRKTVPIDSAPWRESYKTSYKICKENKLREFQTFSPNCSDQKKRYE